MRWVLLPLLAGCDLSFSSKVTGPIDDASSEMSGSIEAGGELAPVGCPGDFMALPSAGSRGRRYKLINGMASWTAHRDACAVMNSWLAFPDGPEAQQELAATTTLAGAGYWTGVNDIVTEGSYRNSLNAPISANTNALVVTTGNPSATDCLVGNTTTLDDEDCAGTRRAVCECVP